MDNKTIIIGSFIKNTNEFNDYEATFNTRSEAEAYIKSKANDKDYYYEIID